MSKKYKFCLPIFIQKSWNICWPASQQFLSSWDIYHVLRITIIYSYFPSETLFCFKLSEVKLKSQWTGKLVTCFSPKCEFLGFYLWVSWVSILNTKNLFLLLHQSCLLWIKSNWLFLIFYYHHLLYLPWQIWCQ